MKLALAFVTLVGFSTAAQAAGGVTIGGGGHGFVSGHRVFLLDLGEGSLERHPYFGTKNSTSRVILPRQVDLKLPASLHLQSTLLNQKIEDIFFLDPVLGLMTVKAIAKMHWTLREGPLVWHKPDGDVKIKTRQVALRTSNETVWIDRALFKRMDAANRVALVIHEAISALQGFTTVDASLARELTRRLFDPRTYDEGREGIREAYETDHFPSVYELADPKYFTSTSPISPPAIVLSARDAATLKWPKNVPPQLRALEREIVFEPIFTLKWVPVDSSGQATGPTQTEIVPFNDRYSASIRLDSACGEPLRGKKLVSAEVGFHLIDADVAPPPTEVPRSARLVMNVTYVPRTRFEFRGANSNRVANCTQMERTQLHAVQLWMATFWPALQ